MKNTRPEFIVGNALDVLRDFDDDSVDLVCTSPPYWGLRSYGKDTEMIWSSADCVHDWDGEIPARGRSNWDSFIRTDDAGGSKFSDGTRRMKPDLSETSAESHGQYCQKCGAWKGQLGLEPTWQLFVEHLVEISKEIKRVLKPTGSYYLVLGDTYASKPAGNPGASGLPGRSSPSGDHSQRMDTSRAIPGDNITKPKQKLLIPYRVAIALQEDGWVCRNDITWHKPNAMPSSVKSRLTCSTERILHMVNNSKTVLWKNSETGEWVNTEPEARHITCWRCNGEKRIRVSQGMINDFMDTDLPAPRGRTVKCDECNGKGKVNVWQGHAYFYDLDAIRIPHKECVTRWGGNVMKPAKKTKYPEGDTRLMYCRPTEERLWRNPTGKNPGDAVETRQKWQDVPGQSAPSFARKRHSGYYSEDGELMVNPLGKNPGDYWSITTKGFPGAHFAVFPEALIEPIIKSSCPPDGIVLDPFCGSGTTNLVAMKLGRASIGIDINSDYIKIAQKRCRVDIPSLQDFGGEDD